MADEAGYAKAFAASGKRASEGMRQYAITGDAKGNDYVVLSEEQIDSLPEELYDLYEPLEAVMRKKTASASTPKPETTSEEPVEMCTVRCSGLASFSGGGYSGAKSGQVPKGTVITVDGVYRAEWQRNGKTYNVSSVPFSYTVNGNVSFNNYLVN